MVQRKKTREEILYAVVDMLQNRDDLETITVRKIAEVASVNIALINYYFQSKEKLIQEAVDICMGLYLVNIDPILNQGVTALERLKVMIIGISDFSFKTKYLSMFSITKDVNEGSIHTVSLVEPILKEIFGDQKNEQELKIIAMQIITPVQMLFLNCEIYSKHLHLNLEDKEQRDIIITQMIDNIIDNK